ncbi:MAG: hypothetical protein AUF79_12885 [Crenarchaeota archaeon 13_1_20CM_2_51_8]|nr:MAG: hypothetical protein AUF79_12885 [Crenarchaeota archaeon 13_1_20CM_2_51_8]
MSYSRLNHVLPVLLTAKQLVGLVYVAIAVLAAGLAAVQTNGNVQWFYTAQSLDPYIGGVTFRLDGQPLGYPFAIVVASLRNPSTYNGLSISGANFAVFVSSATGDLNVSGSSEIVNNPRGISRLITGGSTLNLTSAFQIHPDAVDPLRVFLGNHTSDLVYYVGLTVYLESVYGTFSIPYCYQFPGNTIAACPSSRAPSGGGLRGG